MIGVMSVGEDEKDELLEVGKYDPRFNELLNIQIEALNI